MRTLKERDIQPPPSQVLPVLQFRAIGEPLLPSLISLELLNVTEESIPFVPLFLSPRITSILLIFWTCLSRAMVASMITTLPTLCPNLERISLHYVPTYPMVIAALSEMLLATNRNTLQELHIDSPLTEEAKKVVYKLPNLRNLSVVVDGPGSLPTFVLPNLTTIDILCGSDHGWLQGFHGATLGKLTSVTFHSVSSSIGNLLGAFESAAITTSITATLSKFKIVTLSTWRPDCRSLLPFTQLKELDLIFPCGRGCSSTIDDNIVTDLAQAMPELEILRFGKEPCKTPASVTLKGLAALAYHCPHLSKLRIHFRVDDLNPSEILQVISDGKYAMPREDCVLTDLEVGEIHVPEEFTSAVALILLDIFPHLDCIRHTDPSWAKVEHTIGVSKKLKWGFIWWTTECY